MNDRIVTDRNIIPDPHLCLLIRGMDHHSILNIDLVTDMDASDIPPYYGIEPNAAMIADLYFTDDSRIGCNETAIAKARGLTFDW
jgi:hypothetical protein